VKISTLLKREPFEKIFEETMALFLNDFTNTEHKVSWGDNKTSQSLSDNKQYWYCNPLINSIFVKKVNTNVFNSINGEYQHNPLKPWRSIFQRLYLFLSQSKYTSIFMSKYTISISPPIKDAKNKLIIGGNNKIRIIDIASKTVYVILKKGFDKKYIEIEAFARSKFPYLPIPKINEYGNNGLWYQEEYVSGVPPNRMEKGKGKDVLFNVVKCIHRMLKETKKETSVFKYVETLQEKINNGLDSISYINENVKNDMQVIISKLISCLEEYSNKSINVAYCHGDLHQGNILADENNYWILDWECGGYKQIGHDLLILLLKSRMESGFSNRFLKLVDEQFDNNQRELIKNWPGLNWGDEFFKEVCLIIFLLEDIDFHLGEINNNMFYKNTEVLTGYCNELKKITYNSKWTILNQNCKT